MKMVWDATRGGFDLAVTKSGGLDGGDPLGGAVIVSLFSDRTADPADMTPDLGPDRRGWWGDALRDSADRLGSLLWIKRRQKKTEQVRRSIEDEATAALAWLIEDGIAATVEVKASFPPELADWIVLQVVITEPNGVRRDWKIDVLWSALAD